MQWQRTSVSQIRVNWCRDYNGSLYNGRKFCRLLRGVSVVADRRNPGVDKVSGAVVSGGSFEGVSDGNIEGVGPREGDIMVI